MFLHLGGKVVINSETIIGIFDLDNTTNLMVTRDFLRTMQNENRVINVSFNLLPKSFVVCQSKNEDYSVMYVSPLTTATIYKRMQQKLGIALIENEYTEEENQNESEGS